MYNDLRIMFGDGITLGLRMGFRYLALHKKNTAPNKIKIFKKRGNSERTVRYGIVTRVYTTGQNRERVISKIDVQNGTRTKSFMVAGGISPFQYIRPHLPFECEIDEDRPLGKHQEYWRLSTSNPEPFKYDSGIPANLTEAPNMFFMYVPLVPGDLPSRAKKYEKFSKLPKLIALLKEEVYYISRKDDFVEEVCNLYDHSESKMRIVIDIAYKQSCMDFGVSTPTIEGIRKRKVDPRLIESRNIHMIDALSFLVYHK